MDEVGKHGNTPRRLHIPQPGGKEEEHKLGGHALDAFEGISRTTLTSTIQRDDVIERVNGDRVTKAPRPEGTGENYMDQGDTATR